MTLWHGYVLLENTGSAVLTMTDERRATIRHAFETVTVPWDGAKPEEAFQVLISLDGNKAIYEFVIEVANLNVEVILNEVAKALGMPPGRLRVLFNYEIFGEGGSWRESQIAARAYLAANESEWSINDELD